ncbi:type 1 glutamine amidotransferase [Nitriliruptor alkaliphilus]|uniref:type 1 glutamine amidotransferase n=1 Tax=Nitriliruptor alkaliphilus TaxID=427918 RepID=UPI000697A31F|nr:type 1 glutamine amidotransferase [Nitriliruptor alkaliphilus]
MELLVLDHHATAGPCRFVDVLDSRADLAPWRSIDIVGGGALPEDLDAVAGIVVMGGPQSVTEDHAWQAGELRLLRHAIDAEVPVFGVCLGAQLLAVATGGEVTTRAVPEIGFVPQRHSDEGSSDELTAGWPDGAATVLWHGDEVTTLPPDAVPLLHGDEQVTAWRIGSAFATQAHPEVDVAQLERWMALDELDHQFADSGVDPDAFLAEAACRERFLLATGLSLFGRFVDGPVRRRVTGSSR